MINNWLILLAAIGFLLAGYIRFKRGKEKEMACVIGKKCHSVLKSKYNHTFGIKNEIFGMLYYLVVIVLALMFIYGVTSLVGISISLILIVLGIAAFLFSLYLTYVQFFVLKAICDYCLASALVNLLILVIELI